VTAEFQEKMGFPGPAWVIPSRHKHPHRDRHGHGHGRSGSKGNCSLFAPAGLMACLLLHFITHHLSTY